MTLETRFWAKVERLGDDECWGWNGCHDPSGYSKMYDGRGHRISYELHYGPIPPGLTIDHLCGNKECVNPRHLEAVTVQENLRRYHAQRTHCNKGHSWAENAYQPRSGRKRCRICARAKSARGAAQQRRKRLKAKAEEAMSRVRFDSPLEMEMNGRTVRVLRLVPSNDPDIEDEFVVEDDAGRQWHAFPCELHVVPNG